MGEGEHREKRVHAGAHAELHKQRTCPLWTLLDLDALELFVASSTDCFLHLIQRLHDAVEGAEEFQ